MRAGHGVIYQGALALGSFAGIADFLVRVDGPSILGSYHYEVWDTKLARKPKPYFIIQLCCYAEMLEGIQGRLPSELQVVLGTKERRRFRTEDYFYYYRQLKLAFLDRQTRFELNEPPDVPGPKGLGRWSEHARKILEAARFPKPDRWYPIHADPPPLRKRTEVPRRHSRRQSVKTSRESPRRRLTGCGGRRDCKLSLALCHNRNTSYYKAIR